jgi:2-phospho-L-lactate guanylyltransferase
MGQCVLTSLPGVWAIVPVKRLRFAKQRLQDFLSESERIKLAKSMLIDVLANLHGAQGVTGILIVSNDPEVSRLAAPFGATIINDESEAGTNSAVIQGLREIDLVQAVVLVVPADIPFATTEDFDAVIQALYQDPVVLSPATSDGGTNALAMRSASFVAPCFGEDSFIRHMASARLKGLDCGIVRSWGLGHDVDRPDDLFASAGSRSSLSATSKLLDELNLADRLGPSALPACVRYM